MANRALPLLSLPLLCISLGAPSGARADGNVLKWQVDAANTGHYPAETVLTPSSVNSATFGKVFSTPVDGQVYAHPLFVEQVAVTVGPKPGPHNVVFVATEGDSVYAIDADTGVQQWTTSLIPPGAGNTTVPFQDVQSSDLAPQIGITGTPVIDDVAGTLYVVAKTKEVRTNVVHYVYRLHALDLGSGVEKLGGPSVIADNGIGPSVPGNASDSSNGVVQFNPAFQLQRPGLILTGGRVYVGFGSHGDIDPFHGWLLGFDATTLKLVAVLNLSPNASLATPMSQMSEQGSLWMAGASPAVDDDGSIFVASANGTFDAANSDYGDSILRIKPTMNGVTVADYFTPWNENDLNTSDEDLGSGGIVLLPDAVGSNSHQRLLFVAGKEPTMYVADRKNLGQFTKNGPNQIVQELDIGNWMFGNPAYFNNQIYVCSVVYQTTAKAHSYSIANGAGQFNPVAASESSMDFSWPCGSPSVSSNRGVNGVVWMLDHDSQRLFAYDAGGYDRLVYGSDQAAANRDALSSVVKFSSPTVANGHVYVGTDDALVGYGLIAKPKKAPVLLSAAAGDARVTLDWAPTPGASSYTVLRGAMAGGEIVLTTLVAGTTYLDGGLVNGTTYYYEIIADNPLGSSGVSNEKSATPMPMPDMSVLPDLNVLPDLTIAIDSSAIDSSVLFDSTISRDAITLADGSLRPDSLPPPDLDQSGRDLQSSPDLAASIDSSVASRDLASPNASTDGTLDGPAQGGTTGGCACDVGGRSVAPSWPALLLAGVALALRSRRRSARDRSRR